MELQRRALFLERKNDCGYKLGFFYDSENCEELGFLRGAQSSGDGKAREKEAACCCSFFAIDFASVEVL
jgi:hypothetical protein